MPKIKKCFRCGGIIGCYCGPAPSINNMLTEELYRIRCEIDDLNPEMFTAEQLQRAILKIIDQE